VLVGRYRAPETLDASQQQYRKDNDHLFVCFSLEAAAPPEGDAPFHNEIKGTGKEE
jgi:hypothetical protein